MAEQFTEAGTPGMQIWGGWLNQAYISDLYWPGVFPIYNRLRRSDPEITICRQVFTAMTRGQRIEFVLPDEPSDDDKRFVEFGEQALDDVEGGQSKLLEDIVNYVPFMGWGWWEAVPGLRLADWRPPDKNDPWRSEYDDGLIGFRRFGFRDHSSFFSWVMDNQARLQGMTQLDPPHPMVTLPLDRSLHIVFGDMSNPEGLTPMESVYRLERVKYALELILGMGFEHAAGYLDVRADKELSADDKSLIKKIARSLLSAHEGNYAAWPSHLTGEVKDITFQAGASLLEVIKYYGVLKLQLFNMQWAALSATTGAGSYSAMSDSSGMFVITFNSMMKGFANQLDAQLGRRLYRMNKDKFPGITRRPRLTITPVEKTISLTEIGQLISAMGADNLGDEDWLAIRKATKILPEKLPEKEEAPAPVKDTGDQDNIEEDAEENIEDDAGENVDNTEQAVQQAMAAFQKWARENDPETGRLLQREA